jgi:hypothetical protein
MKSLTPILILVIALLALAHGCGSDDPSYDDCYTKKCYSGDVWCYGSDGTRDHRYRSCNDCGCTGGYCSSCQDGDTDGDDQEQIDEEPEQVTSSFYFCPVNNCEKWTPMTMVPEPPGRIDAISGNFYVSARGRITINRIQIAIGRKVYRYHYNVTDWEQIGPNAPGDIGAFYAEGYGLAVGNLFYEWDFDSETWVPEDGCGSAPAAVTAMETSAHSPVYIAAGARQYYVVLSSDCSWRERFEQAPGDIRGIWGNPPTFIATDRRFYYWDGDAWVVDDDLPMAPKRILSAVVDSLTILIAVER